MPSGRQGVEILISRFWSRFSRTEILISGFSSEHADSKNLLLLLKKPQNRHISDFFRIVVVLIRSGVVPSRSGVVLSRISVVLSGIGVVSIRIGAVLIRIGVVLSRIGVVLWHIDVVPRRVGVVLLHCCVVSRRKQPFQRIFKPHPFRIFPECGA